MDREKFLELNEEILLLMKMHVDIHGVLIVQLVVKRLLYKAQIVEMEI